MTLVAISRAIALEDEQGLYTEPESLVPASALSQPCSPTCSIELLLCRASQPNHSRILRSRSEDIQHGSACETLQESRKQLQSKEQGWEEGRRRGNRHRKGDVGEAQAREDEQQKEPTSVENDEQHPNLDAKVSNTISDCFHEASDENDGDDEGSRPAKRRRLGVSRGLSNAYLPVERKALP